MENNLTSRQSLDIIAQTIKSTRARIERNSGRPFLIWGYTVVAVSLMMFFITLTTERLGWGWLWFLIPVVGVALTSLFPRKDKAEPRTEFDRIIGRVWLVLALGIAPAFVIAIFSRGDVFGIITLLMAAGVAITGLVIRSRIYTVAGFAGMALSSVFAIFGWWLKEYATITDDNIWVALSPMLIYALVFIVMMVVPGHIMNAKTRRQ